MTANHPAPLPSPTTSLIGRDRTLTEITSQLGRPDVRLLTLVGAPGVGKTRLALALGRLLADDYPGGVFFVQLSSADSVAGALVTILAALDLPLDGGARALREFFRARRALLLLDNLEHLADFGLVVAELLAWAASLDVLATSRSALHVSGEHEFHVLPLPVPSGDTMSPRDLSENPSVALFLARARANAPRFDVTSENAPAVAQLCRRLEGIPLAIELAAARLKYLDVPTLLSRLENRMETLRGGARDLPARQQALDAAIAWSYDLLSPEQRRFFAELSVFAGEWTADAAGVVCSRDHASDSADALASLLDHSLVRRVDQHDTLRMAMLETLREFAMARLRDEWRPMRADVERRHAAYFLDLARRAGPTLRGADARAALDELDLERDNLRVALDWSVTAADSTLALGLCAALRDYWRIRGALTEGRAAAARSLAMGGGSDAERARCLCAAGMLARLQGDLSAASEQLAHAAQLAALADEPRTRAEALTELGVASIALGALDAAEAQLAEAWSIWAREADVWGRLLALHARARLAVARSDLKHARALRLEAVELAVATGDQEWEARARVGLGDVSRLQRDFFGAREEFERALALYRAMDNSVHLALGLRKFAHVALHVGDFSAARTALVESVSVFSRIEHRVGIAACALSFACVLSAQKNDVAAVRLCAASSMMSTDETGMLQPADERDRDDALARSRSRLGDAAFEEAVAQGRITPLDELLSAAIAAPLAAERVREDAAPSAGAVAHAALTARELDVLRLLPHGLSYAEIGRTLLISARTVDAHLRAIYAKLNVRSRHEAAGYALRHGLARLGDVP